VQCVYIFARCLLVTLRDLSLELRPSSRALLVEGWFLLRDVDRTGSHLVLGPSWTRHSARWARWSQSPVFANIYIYIYLCIDILVTAKFLDH
jgi:hypothetical protein